MFDPLLDPILEGDPDEVELAERMAVYDAYMGLFDIELDRVLYRHGMAPTEQERSRIKWVVARFMQEASTSDLDALEPALIERFLPREQELRLLDQELDWVIDRHEGEVSSRERAEIREWVVEFFDTNVTLGLADLERIYVTAVIPNRLLDRHLEQFGLWISANHEGLTSGDAWGDFARWLESEVERMIEADTEETGVRAIRLQAMQLPKRFVAPLVEWALQPESVLHGAAGLRLAVSVRREGTREEVIEAFRVLDRFWKILLIRQGGEEQSYWSGVLKESSRN
jgi:hypothetical protein